jgi:hypothetical protein
MDLTGREREVMIALCKKKAQECRDRASRIGFPDLRESAQQTARMWEEMAASVIGTGTLDELLASAPGPVANDTPAPHSETSSTDESGSLKNGRPQRR